MADMYLKKMTHKIQVLFEANKNNIIKQSLKGSF